MDMKACRDGRYKRSKQCYCVLSRVSCLSTLSTLVYVTLTQHLIQSTMRCENCIDSVDIDSIECIRDPCLVSTVLTNIVLMLWLKSPESQLSKTFCRLKIHWKLRKLWAQMCMSFVSTVSTYIALNASEILMPSVDSVNIYNIWWYGWKALSLSFSKLFADWKSVEH